MFMYSVYLEFTRQFLLFQTNQTSSESDSNIFLSLSLLLSLSLFHPLLRCSAGFGGCIRDVRFARGPVVSLAAVSSSAVRVNLDGCLSADTSVNCRGNDSILVYTGRDSSTEDLTLQPFTGKSSIRPLFASTIPTSAVAKPHWPAAILASCCLPCLCVRRLFGLICPFCLEFVIVKTKQKNNIICPGQRWTQTRH